MLSQVDQTSIQFRQNKKRRANYKSVLENPGVWGIVLSYSYEYSLQMIRFCQHFHLSECLKQLNTLYNKNSKDCAKRTTALLSNARETAFILKDSQERIEAGVAELKKQNLQALEHKIFQLSSDSQIQLEKMIADDRAILNALKTKIAVQETAMAMQLEQKKVEQLQIANREYETALFNAKTIGFIAREQKLQTRAKIDLDEQRKELAESDCYFEEIHRTIFMLEDFPLGIDAEIAKKKRWNDRFRWITAAELDARYGASLTMNQRIRKTMFRALIAWLAYAYCITAAITMMGLFTALFLNSTIDIVTVIVISVAIGATIAALIVGLDIFIRYNDGGNERFEQHKLSSSFPPNLREQLGEIKQKISVFQDANTIFEPVENEHPLLMLDQKAKVADIREAVNHELTFFKNLYAQAPNNPELQSKSEEPALDLNEFSIALENSPGS